MELREFNGRKYRLVDTITSKRVAVDVAQGFRKRGDSARVAKHGLGYGVYVRDVTRRRKSLGYR